MSEGPRRLSWGNRRQTNSRPCSHGGTVQPSELLKHDSCTASSYHEGQLCRDQQPQLLLCQNPQQPCASLPQQCYPPSIAPTEQQACKAILREVLSAVLGQSGSQLDHFQLLLPAVLAVLKHKLAEAADAGQSKGSAAASAAAKQHVEAAQKEAEAKAAKQLQCMVEQAAAAAAQHSQVVSSLEAQLSTLQRQHKQLQGKSAQQARDLREATDVGKAARLQQQAVQEDLQALKKQLQGKAAALSRSTSVRQQEAAALKAELQQSVAAAEAVAAQHQQELLQLHQAQEAQLAALTAQHKLHVQQQLQDAAAVHLQQQSQLWRDLQGRLALELQPVHAAVKALQQHQQAEEEAVQLQQQEEYLQAARMLDDAQKQLQEVRSELASVQADVQEFARLAAVQQAALHDMQRRQAEVAPEGLEALAEQAREAATAKASHAAALQQLQATCLQLATVQPTVQQLQQQCKALGEQRDALQEQLAQAHAAAAAQQQEHQQQATRLQQQVQDLQAHGGSLQQQLQAASLQLSDAQQEAAAAAARAATAEQQLEQAAAQGHAYQCSVEAAYSQGLQQQRERLLWLCSSYFLSEQSLAADSSSTAAPSSITRQPGGPSPAEDPSTSLMLCGVAGGAGDVVTSRTGISSCSTAQGKLQQLFEHLAGDGERLLRLFEQYKAHKQEVLAAAAGSSTPSNSDRSHTNPTPPAPAQAATPDAVLQLQQQVLQLEACLLNFMLSIQEALAESRARQCSSSTLAGLGVTFSHAGVSPSRPERPSTAMSCSSSATGFSSRSSSLGSQLLAAMRREKQQLALELKKAHSIKRTPLTVVASAAAFPWQRRTEGGSQATTPRAAGTDVGGGGSSGRTAHGAQVWVADSNGGHKPEFQDAGAAGACSAGGGVGAGLAQAECWEDVDEVLQLLQGCQLGAQPSSKQPAGHTSTTGGTQRSSPVKPAGVHPCDKQLQAARSVPAHKLQWGFSSSSSKGGASNAAAAAGAKSPGRTVSLQVRQQGPAGCSPVLRKSASCGVQPGRTGVQASDRGIGSLMARR